MIDERGPMPTVYVLLAAVLWSTGGLGVKSVDMQPLALAGFRSAFAVPVLGIAALILARRHDVAITTLLRRPLVWTIVGLLWADKLRQGAWS